MYLYVLGSDVSSDDSIQEKKLRCKHKAILICYLDTDIVAYYDLERPIIQTNIALALDLEFIVRM